jgi:hypothetical protein
VATTTPVREIGSSGSLGWAASLERGLERTLIRAV